jgi:glutathione S-transferase
VATLYRCRTPTDWLCQCGTVARRLRRSGIEFDEVRVPFPKSERPEVEELTGQRRVPVLVHDDEVIHDSHRILEYLRWLEGERARSGARDEPARSPGGDETSTVGAEAARGHAAGAGR